MSTFQYSDKYTDDTYEYRHVIVPFERRHAIPRQLMTREQEWRNLGVQQSAGWVHYMQHKPEPYVLLFRRPLEK